MLVVLVVLVVLVIIGLLAGYVGPWAFPQGRLLSGQPVSQQVADTCVRAGSLSLRVFNHETPRFSALAS